MDKHVFLYKVCGLFLAGHLLSVNSPAQVSVEDFMNPPRDARPGTYWEWMNGNITKEGLTRDLAYMKCCHYGAAMMFETGLLEPMHLSLTE